MPSVSNPSPPPIQSLGIFKDLLAEAAGGLDVRDVLRHLSAVASLVVPHDEARLILGTDSPSERRQFRSTPDGVAEDLPARPATPSNEGRQPQIVDAAPGAHQGLQSGLSVPIAIDDQVVGTLGLFSRRPRAYSHADLAQAESLAACLAAAISHQRQAEQARHAAAERERAAMFEHSVELLRVIAGVLDIRAVLPRVSEIANKLLPHDALTLSAVDSRRKFVGDGLSTPDFPLPPLVGTTTAIPDELIISDLRTEPLPLDPPVLNDRLVAAGFRALVFVMVRAGGDRMEGVGFWSKHPDAFARRDLPMARQVAEFIALAVSHESLADAARQIGEARARAEFLEARVQVLARELETKTSVRVAGESTEWRAVLKRATQVAQTDTTVLLTGESGTGKEVVARFIHRASARSAGPFVALNCAALPEQLLESELFGYERGAFTSANQAKPGHIELAAGGVLFLDEVTEMSPSAQAKFLRVLQEREFQRLGATRILKANVRVIAASNRDLWKAVERGDFREDLFYRLRVFDITIPPLRERRADILPLADAFLKDIETSLGRPLQGLTRDARAALLEYGWPGNVRELRNTLERAAILCDGELIGAEHLALQAMAKPVSAGSTDLASVERETIAQVLRECRWNKARAARRLGLTRTQLYVRIRRHGLEAPAAL